MSGLSSLPVSPFVAGWHGAENVCLIYTIQLFKFLTGKCVSLLVMKYFSSSWVA